MSSPTSSSRAGRSSKGQFVVVEDADLEAIEQRDTSRSIEIGRFVGPGEVDPVYFDRTYFLVPAGTEAARRPYVLLLAAMKEGEHGRARPLRARRQGEAVPDPPAGDALALETLFVAEDVHSQAEIDEAVGVGRGADAELDARPADHRSRWPRSSSRRSCTSEYRESLRGLLEAKLEGQEIVGPGAALRRRRSAT